MAGEEQYINPIIQAMVHSANTQQQQEQLKQQQAQLKAQIAQHDIERQLHEKGLEQSQQRLDWEKEHGLGMLEAHKAMTEAQVHMLQTENLLKMRQASLQHIDLSEALKPGALPGAGIPTPLQAQQQEAQRIRSEAFAKSEGQSQGALGAQQALLTQQGQQASDLAEKAHAAQMQIAIQHGQDELAATKVRGQYANSNANINGAYHLRGIAMLNSIGEGENGEKAKQLTDGIYNGNIDFKALPQTDKRLVETYATGTGELKSLPQDHKDYSEKIDSLGRIQTLINQYRELANNFSRDSPGAKAKGNQNLNLPVIGTLHRTKPGSDLASAEDAMKASAGQLSSYFNKQNRPTDTSVIREVAGSFNAAATKDQNLEKLNKHIQQLQGTVKRTFGTMSPDRINKILGDKGITDFGAFGAAQGTHKVWNPQTNEFEDKAQ
jgi:hypothetical protein